MRIAYEYISIDEQILRSMKIDLFFLSWIFCFITVWCFCCRATNFNVQQETGSGPQESYN